MSFHGDFVRPAVSCRDHEHFRPQQTSFYRLLSHRPAEMTKGLRHRDVCGHCAPALRRCPHTGSAERPKPVLPSKSTTCNARELACDLHYSQPKRAGMWISTTSRKSELQTAALYTWAVVLGLTMLVSNGLANVEQLCLERLAQKVVTTLRGLEWSGA